MKVHFRNHRRSDKPETGRRTKDEGIKIQIEVAWASMEEDWVVDILESEARRVFEEMGNGSGYLATRRIEHISVDWS